MIGHLLISAILAFFQQSIRQLTIQFFYRISITSLQVINYLHTLVLLFSYLSC